MPTPRKGEKKEDYLSRCIPMLIDEGRKPDQAVAICSSMYDEHHQEKTYRMKRDPSHYWQMVVGLVKGRR